MAIDQASVTEANRPLLIALEGYYGPPLGDDERLAMLEFLAAHDYDGYAYSPKDDPYHRDRWREPYPPEDVARLRALQETCAGLGLQLHLSIAPGLDWNPDDPGDVEALVAKLEVFLDIGAAGVAVVWDDVPGEGPAVGAMHGRAVADAIERVGADRAHWVTCPVDYALDVPTGYFTAFVEALPPSVGVAWTGPAIVSPWVDGGHARRLADASGHGMFFGENYPVNDGGMAQVLHLGPYPPRGADLVDQSAGVLVNFMHLPRASRIGLATAARFWRNPGGDRRADWNAVLDEFPGIEPLARACSSWLDDPGPDPELLGWAEAAKGGDTTALRSYLEAGCRAGIEDEALAAEVEPWAAQWDLEAGAMLAALHLLELDRAPSMEEVGAVALHWHLARRGEPQVFGIRFAYYPVNRRDGDRLTSDPRSVVHGPNLTDLVCTWALDRWK